MAENNNTLLEKLDGLVARFEEVSTLITDPNVIADQKRYVKLTKEYKDLNDIMKARREYIQCLNGLEEAKQIMTNESDPEMKEMAREEANLCEVRIPELEEEIKLLLVPADPQDDRNAILEIRGGTGGDEAAIFAGDLFRMYSKYCETKGWRLEVSSANEGAAGGFKEIICSVTGDKVYGTLKYESGVHRVQRVPATETQGRVHTSAASVAVLPEAEPFDVEINEGEIKWDTFRSGGAGGQNGQFRGGPSYYMERALGKRWMGILFSILLILCFAYGFNGLQAYNMSSALEYYIPNYSETMGPMIVGLIIAAATALVIFGGTQRIGFFSSVIVPIMAGLYILLGLVTMVMNITELPAVFALIFREAFDVQAIMGGFAGSAVVIGIKRGLFSNEAGMGSAPNASASADVEHPVNQGLVQVISVFIDTILICSATAMMLFVSGVEGVSGVMDGIPFVQAAVKANVGEFGIHFITFSIFAFAFSSVIGNYFYAESNILFIKNSKFLLFCFRITCVVVVFLGAQADFSLVWNLADVTMGFMAIVNIIAIFMLRKTAIAALDNYEQLKKQGKKPVFDEKSIGLTGTVWSREE